MLKRTIAVATIAVLATFGALQAQSPPPAPAGIKRTVLQTTDVPGSSYVVLVAQLEVQAGIKIPRHTHPGTVGGSVIEGTYSVQFDGQPEKVYKPGDYIEIPAGTVHSEWAGDKPAKLMVVYTVEKGKPLASMIP